MPAVLASTAVSHASENDPVLLKVARWLRDLGVQPPTPPADGPAQEPMLVVPPVEVPPGWRLVPEEPTDEMLSAGRHPVTVRGAWRAMLAAAPQRGEHAGRD